MPVNQRPPDVFIVTHKHPTGADMVTVRMRKENYPPELLQKQCLALGQELGSPPRGLNIYAQEIGGNTMAGAPDGSTPSNIISASFAVDGLVDEVNKRINIQALVRAFAGGNGQFNNTALDIIFEGETPAVATLQSYRYPADTKSRALVELFASAVPNPPAVEYTVGIGSTKPDDIVIPSSITEVGQVSAPKAPTQGGSRLNWIAIGLGMLGIAIGTVIIFLARRAHSRAPQIQ